MLSKTIYKGIFNALFLLSFLFLSLNTHATFRFSNLDPGKNVSLPDWSNSGSVTLNVDFCAISTQGNGPNGPPTPFSLVVQNRAAGEETLPFRITNLADPTQILPVSMTFFDLYGGGITETMNPNVYTAQDKTGATNKCPAGNNGRIELVINQADLESVFAGNYRGSFNVDGLGGTGGLEAKSTFFTVNLTILDLMQISNVDDLVFPIYSIGMGNQVLSEDFCIYRNANGTYQMLITGSGAASAFTVTNGADIIPYTLTYDDSAGPVNVTTNTPLTNQQNVFTANLSCDGSASNNGTITVTFLSTDLDVVPFGSYTGVITLLVSPE